MPTIHLSFHLNEHYNSVRRGDDPSIKGIVPVKEYPIGHDLEEVKILLQGKTLMLDPVTQVDSDDEKGRKKNKNRAPEKDVIPEEVLNYASDFIGKNDPDWKILTRTLEEVFDGRNLSKLKLNDVDHKKK